MKTKLINENCINIYILFLTKIKILLFIIFNNSIISIINTINKTNNNFQNKKKILSEKYLKKKLFMVIK